MGGGNCMSVQEMMVSASWSMTDDYSRLFVYDGCAATLRKRLVILLRSLPGPAAARCETH